MNDWCTEFFDGSLDEAILTNNPVEIENICAFVKTFFSKNSNFSVFDQCCGKGFLSFEFAQKGHNVLGVDICKNYIDFAKNFASPNCKFVCNDAKTYISPQKFDVAINWNSSFTYDEDDDENFKMIEAMSANLNDDGRFFLSTINADFIKKNLIQFLNRDFEMDGVFYKCVKESYIENEIMRSYWHIESPDGKKETKFAQQKLYSLNDFKSWFLKYNLSVEEVYGNLLFQPCTENTGSMIIYGKKQKN